MDDFSPTNQTNERVEDIYATRSFVLSESTDGRIKLAGLTFSQPILPGINVAQCPGGKHLAPDAKCSCGFYCYDDPEGRLWPWLNEQHGRTVDAIVRVSGRVTVHPSGIRAECIEVVAIITNDRELAGRANKWNPSIPVFDYIEDALEEFPIDSLPRDKRSKYSISTEAKNIFLRLGLLLMTIAVAAGLAGLQVLSVSTLKQPILTSAIGFIGLPFFLWARNMNMATTRIVSVLAIFWMNISILIGFVVSTIGLFRSSEAFTAGCSIAVLLALLFLAILKLVATILIPAFFLGIMHGYNPSLRVQYGAMSFSSKVK